MSECRRTAERVAPYVDDTLQPDERAAVDAHLDACPPCRRAVQEAAGGRRVLLQGRRCLSSPSLPPGLRTRCEALARDHGTRRRARGWAARLLPAAAIALLVLTTALVVFAMATRRSSVLLAQQLTADHVKCFRWFAPAGSAGADAHVIEDMLAHEYGWDVHVPPSSAAEGITLMGARRCLYASGTIPHVMYRVAGENLSLFVLDGERRGAEVDTFGHRSKIWSEGGSTYVLVSSRDTASLDEAAQYIMEQERIR